MAGVVADGFAESRHRGAPFPCRGRGATEQDEMKRTRRVCAGARRRIQTGIFRAEGGRRGADDDMYHNRLHEDAAQLPAPQDIHTSCDSSANVMPRPSPIDAVSPLHSSRYGGSRRSPGRPCAPRDDHAGHQRRERRRPGPVPAHAGAVSVDNGCSDSPPGKRASERRPSAAPSATPLTRRTRRWPAGLYLEASPPTTRVRSAAPLQTP
eukprot:ctg_2107.g482